MMACAGCKKESTNIHGWIENGQYLENCDQCSTYTVSNLADVYWPGHAYKSEALDVEFTSRGQKAQYLKDHDLSEAGDRGSMATKSWTEGTREHRAKQFDKERPMIREVYKQYLKNVRSRG